MTSQSFQLGKHPTRLDAHQPTPDDDEIDLAQLTRTLWRGKFFIILTTLIALVIGGWYAYSVAVPLYTSTATVAMESREEQMVDITSVMTGLSGDQASINTEVEVFKSRGLIEKLVVQLSLVEDPEFNPHLRSEPRLSVSRFVEWVREIIGLPPELKEEPSPRRVMDTVIDNVLEAISINNIRQSLVFRVTAVTEQAEKSALIANSLAELYIQDQLEIKFAATEKATVWLTDRVSQLQVQLEAAEAAAKEFNAQTELVSPEALIVLNRRIKELRDRLRETREDEAVALARLNALIDAKEAGDFERLAEISIDPALTNILDEANASNVSPADSALIENRYQQVLARARLEAERVSNQVATLQATISDQEARAARQSADLVTLQQLQREAEASRLIYEFFLGRLKETSVQQGIQQADSRLLSQAVVPLGPTSPKKPLILALSLVLGGLLGSAIVLGREFAQNTFRDSTELEGKTGHTVIGQIPAIPARRRKNVLKYLTDRPTSAAAEAIRNLRTSILLSDIDNPPQIIMSTSSIPGEGKTTQSLALAQNLTGLGKKVLLIEGDIRKRVFAEYFDIQDKKGLIAVLSGEAKLEEAVSHEPTLNADILIGEKTETNAADIFSSERFTRFLEDLRSKYDYVIIDTPPVLAVPDARVIGRSMDAVIYTVKWDSTSQRQVREGLKSLENVQVRVTGLVLSQINAKGMKKYGYGETYGAYGDYHNN